MPEVTRPQLVTPPPMRVDARRIVAAGTAVWAVAFLALAPFWTWLGRHHHHAWLWTCLEGVALGLAGLALMSRHRGQGRTG